MSARELEARISEAIRASGPDRAIAIADLRAFAFTCSADTIIECINHLNTIQAVNILLATGLTSRSNEAAMTRRNLLYRLQAKESI